MSIRLLAALAMIVVADAGNDAMGQRFRWDTSFAADGPNGPVHAIASHNGDLYVGGVFSEVGPPGSTIPVSSVARWDGTQWHDVGGGVQRSTTNPDEGEVLALASFDGKLWVGGRFGAVNETVSVNSFASWDGSSWSSAGTGIPSSWREIHSLLGCDGALYASATFSPGGPTDPNAAVFEFSGTGWSSCMLGYGVWNTMADGGAFGLLAGGLFFDAAPPSVENAAFDGPCFKGLPDVESCATYPGPLPQVFGMATFGGLVYLGGQRVCSSTSSCCATGLMSTDASGDWAEHHAPDAAGGAASVGALLVFEESQGAGEFLYAGGRNLASGAFDPVNGSFVNGIGKFNGSEWFGLCTGIPAVVHVLAEHEGDLYAGGDFGAAGGASASNIARWFFDPCIADWDGSGTLDFFDYLEFSVDYSAGNGRADLDCDGQFTSFDQLEFQDLYSEGCP